MACSLIIVASLASSAKTDSAKIDRDARTVMLVCAERRPTPTELSLLGKIRRKEATKSGVPGVRVLSDGEEGLILTLIPDPGGSDALGTRKVALLTRLARNERVNLGDLSPVDRAAVYHHLAMPSAKPLPDSTPVLGSVSRQLILKNGEKEVRLPGDVIQLGPEGLFESALDASEEWPVAPTGSQPYLPPGAVPMASGDGLYSIQSGFLWGMPSLTVRRKLTELAYKQLFDEALAAEEDAMRALQAIDAAVMKGTTEAGRRVNDLPPNDRRTAVRDVLENPSRYGFGSKSDAEAWLKDATVSRVALTGTVSIPRRTGDMRGTIGIGW